jgi:DNA-binding CsgD family transcriptional regulator
MWEGRGPVLPIASTSHGSDTLTPHETRLLRMMVEGHDYKSAAKEFGVTTHAISFDMRRIYEELQVHSKSEAGAKALKPPVLGRSSFSPDRHQGPIGVR